MIRCNCKGDVSAFNAFEYPSIWDYLIRERFLKLNELRLWIQCQHFLGVVNMGEEFPPLRSEYLGFGVKARPARQLNDQLGAVLRVGLPRCFVVLEEALYFGLIERLASD
jgi:hypothetical protein